MFNAKLINLNTTQLELNTEQSAKLDKSSRANVQVSSLNHILALNQIFIQKPYLKPYFYNGTSIDVKDERFQEVSAMAEMILDVFDLFATKTIATADYWEDFQSFDVWISDTFTSSPILRETFDQNSDWWCKEVLALRKKAQEKLDKQTAEDTNLNK